MSDIYDNWRAMLRGESVPIHPDQPYAGRYMLRRHRDAPFLPVAIGPDNEGNLVALVNGGQVDPASVWIMCAKHPITQDKYKFHKANGYWPDEPPPSALSNMPSDPFEALKVDVETKLELADELLKKHTDIKDQTTCNLFVNLQKQLLALNKRGDEMHKTEKAPVLEQGSAIDEKFRFRATVKVMTDRLRSRFETFMRVEERRLQAIAEAKIKADRERIAAERAKQMLDDPIGAMTSPEPEMPPPPDPVKVTAGGGFGRKAGLKSVWLATAQDWDAAIKHYADNAKLRELVQKLADADVRAGKRAIPGFAITEDRRAA